MEREGGGPKEEGMQPLLKGWQDQSPEGEEWECNRGLSDVMPPD